MKISQLAGKKLLSTLRWSVFAILLVFASILVKAQDCGPQPEGGCNECGPYYGDWSLIACPALTNSPGLDPTAICQKSNTAPSLPKITRPAYDVGKKQRTISYDCSDSTQETNDITYTVGGVQWDPTLPGTVTSNFTSTAYVNVTSSDTTLCPSPGRVNIGTVTWTLSPSEITSLCVATTPTNRTRTTIGVGEVVNLSLSPAPSCGTVTWTLSGPGTLSGTTYTAPDRAGSATINVDAGCNCGKWTKTFTIIEPSNEMMVTNGFRHTVNRPDIGFQTLCYIGPDTVNFYNIQVIEVTNNAVCTGVYSMFNGYPHDANPSAVPMTSTVVPGLGTRESATDTVYSGNPTNAPPFAPGSITYDIPLKFRVGTGAWKQFSVDHQVCTLGAGGALTASKAGANWSCNVSDATLP